MSKPHIIVADGLDQGQVSALKLAAEIAYRQGWEDALGHLARRAISEMTMPEEK